MAIDTLRNRTLERRPGMASLTGHIKMSTIKWKACAEVIEWFLRER